MWIKENDFNTEFRGKVKRLERSTFVKYINVVVIDGKEVEIKDLPEETRERLAEEWNRRALEAIGYRRVEEKNK